MKEIIKQKYLLFDGAMGSLLQQQGMKAGELPEEWSIQYPEVLIDIHKRYIQAGANVITSNTFGANPLKMRDANYALKDIIIASIEVAKQALNESGEKQVFLAYDVGPLGSLLKPAGTLHFDEAYAYYKEIAEIIKGEAIDVILLETFSDLYEMKAAVLAFKEHTQFPIISTMTFEDDARTLAGNDVASCVATLEGLGVFALGLNCGFGPNRMQTLLAEFEKYTSIPLIVQPNAGMPRLNDGKLYYDMDAKQFSEHMRDLLVTPVQIIGGCCGTQYEHIAEVAKLIEELPFSQPKKKDETICSSGVKAQVFDQALILIGERLNPTGKRILKEAILEKDYNYIIKEAMAQEREGAHILDVNIGLPKIDEASMMQILIEHIQSYVKVPLQVDSSNPKVLEKGMRYYNGKPMVNSCNGTQESLAEVLPLIRHYGGVLIGLCIDEQGLAITCDEKVAVARKIVDAALASGMERKNIIIDPLTLTLSAQQEDVKATIDAIKIIKEQLQVKTVLGISNVSFGLPKREQITANFLTMCMYAGLNASIINTKSAVLQEAIHSAEALLNIDHDCKAYIKFHQEKAEEFVDTELTLQRAIHLGLKEDSKRLTKELLKERDPLDIIENDITYALNEVGVKFERKKLYLPQLIQSAESVNSAFGEIKAFYAKTKQVERVKNRIILATVKGDVHDIGKNIVRVILENFGYQIIDLGKDVSFETIQSAILEHDVKLVGLSALMTTTVANMEDIIQRVKAENPSIQIMVGGAVLTPEYAQQIGSDYYCQDAMASVKVAKEVFSGKQRLD